MTDTSSPITRRRMAGVLGSAVAVVGLTVCAGWYAHSVTLVQLAPRLPPMKFNTALNLTMLGLSLVAWSFGRSTASRLLAGGALLLSSLTVFQNLAGVSLGIDTLFVEPFTVWLTRQPGRMTYYAALSFIGLSLVLVGQRTVMRRPSLLVASSVVCSLVMLLSCAALVGFATGYRLPLSGGTNMAFHTALCFLALGWGTFAVVCPYAHSRNAPLVNALLTVPVAATSLGVVLALVLLPNLSGPMVDDAEAKPFGPVVAVMAVMACLVSASLLAARTSRLRADAAHEANQRLRAEIMHREQIESAQRLLVSELDHRVRNTLSQVLALAESTSSASSSVEQYHARLRERIRALSRAHSVLARARNNDADLSAFLSAVLEPFMANGESRVELDGPPATIPSRATTALCMVFYELAANASKHGALRVPGGRVRLSWRVLDGDTPLLEMEWREHGGPAITSTPAGGFGTDLIRNMIPHELGGQTELVYAPEGVRCRVRLSLVPGETRGQDLLSPTARE